MLVLIVSLTVTYSALSIAMTRALNCMHYVRGGISGFGGGISGFGGGISGFGGGISDSEVV